MNQKQRNCFRTLIALFGTALLLANQPLSAQEKEVKWKLSKDEQYTVTLEQNSVTKTKVDSRETSIVSETQIVMDWNVTDVSPGDEFTIQQSLASIKISLGDPASPSQTIKYDTSSNNDDISKDSKKLLEQIQPLIGLKFDVVMTNLGRIESVTLPKETSEVINKLPDALSLRSLFTEAGLKDILGAAAIVLPKADIAANETWIDETKVNLVYGAFNRKRNYTYLGNKKIDERDYAEFAVKSEMTQLVDQAQVAKGKLVSYRGSGTLMLDLERGFFSSSKVENEAVTQASYREKKIDTIATNEITMTITPK